MHAQLRYSRLSNALLVYRIQGYEKIIGPDPAVVS